MSSQYETVDDTEDTDFIKNLKEYADEQDRPDYESIMNEKINEVTSMLDDRLSFMQSKIDENSWYDDPDNIDYLSKMYNVNEPAPYNFGDLKQKQMMVESGGNPNAVSPAGAQGAFQFMPATWEQYKPSPSASPFNPEAASKAYDKYMGALLTMFNGDQRKAAAAYNAGEGRVKNLVQQYGNNWEQHLPNETKGYLKKIFK
jgi:muramidase (phage lysozyme)